MFSLRTYIFKNFRSLNNMQLTYLLRDSFVNVQATDISLQNNKIAYIEEGAFDTVSIGDDL